MRLEPEVDLARKFGVPAAHHDVRLRREEVLHDVVCSRREDDCAPTIAAGGRVLDFRIGDDADRHAARTFDQFGDGLDLRVIEIALVGARSRRRAH